MSTFSTFDSVEQRVRTMMQQGKWVVGFAARSFTGQLVAVFQRFMKPTAPAAGGWTSTTDDTVE